MGARLTGEEAMTEEDSGGARLMGEEATTDRQIQRCSTAFLTSASGTAIVPPEGETEVEPPREPGRCSPSKHGRLVGCRSHWAPRAQPQHCSSWCHLPCHRADHPWRPCGSQPPKDRQGDQGTHSSCLAPVQMPQSCCALSGGDAREALAPTGMATTPPGSQEGASPLSEAPGQRLAGGF